MRTFHFFDLVIFLEFCLSVDEIPTVSIRIVLLHFPDASSNFKHAVEMGVVHFKVVEGRAMHNFVGPDLLLDNRTLFVFWDRNRFLINIIKITLLDGASDFASGEFLHKALSFTLEVDVWES